MKSDKVFYVVLALIIFFVVMSISNVANLTYYNFDRIGSINSSISTGGDDCVVNIRSSDVDVVGWDISDSDGDVVGVHCDFEEKKVFGGEVN